MDNSVNKKLFYQFALAFTHILRESRLNDHMMLGIRYFETWIKYAACGEWKRKQKILIDHSIKYHVVLYTMVLMNEA